MGPYQSISPAEAQALVDAGAVHALDVRTPGEYAGLGHIPGAWLLPVDLIASAPPVLPRDGKPVLVCCELGVRSVAACRCLAQAGVSPLLNMSGGMSAWQGPREFGEGQLARDDLYGVSRQDAATIAAVTLLICVVTGVATYIPARRAANVEPARALRE